jgi:hypothetical protein
VNKWIANGKNELKWPMYAFSIVNYWLPLTTSPRNVLALLAISLPSKCSFLGAAVALGDHYPSLQMHFPSFPRMSQLVVGGHQFIICSLSIDSNVCFGQEGSWPRCPRLASVTFSLNKWKVEFVESGRDNWPSGSDSFANQLGLSLIYFNSIPLLSSTSSPLFPY